MASSRVPLDTRLYRACLNGLPLVFRREFSDQMLNDFDDHRTDAIQSGSAGAIWLFRLRMLRDMFRALAVQWVRTGWPVIGVVAMALTLVSTSALATVWRQVDFHLPAGSPDHDVIALVMLTIIVLLFIITTILLTMWSSRFVQRSTRRRV